MRSGQIASEVEPDAVIFVEEARFEFDEIEKLETLLKILKPKHIEVLKLRFIEDKTLEEIAAVRGVTKQNISASQKQSLKK